MSEETRPSAPASKTATWKLSDAVEDLSPALGVGLLITVVLTLTEVFLHRYMYFEGGVRYVDFVGSLAGRLIIIAALAGVVFLLLMEFEAPAIIAAGVVALALAVAQGVMPALAGGYGGVTIGLTLLFSLFLDLVYGAWIFGIAVKLDS